MTNSLQSTKRQIRPVAIVLAMVFTPALIALGMLVAVNQATGIKVSVFTRDPIQVLGGEAYVGVFSNIGILLWAAAAVCCFFASELVRRGSGDKSWKTFLLASGVVTSVLLIDDLFMMHEVVLPLYVGIPETLVTASNALMLLAYLCVFYRRILATDYLILIFAIGFLGVSASTDVVALLIGEFRGVHLIEDGAKLLAIVAWTTYMVRTSLIIAMDAAHPARSTSDQKKGAT